MERIWIILLLSSIWAESFTGLCLKLDNGNLCLQSNQCQSRCCLRRTGSSLARCANKAAENQECFQKLFFGTYYRCPCEIGLICDPDWTIFGGILNSVVGICNDPAKRK
nr:colipase-like [Anolis sagrei ordinatus]